MSREPRTLFAALRAHAPGFEPILRVPLFRKRL